MFITPMGLKKSECFSTRSVKTTAIHQDHTESSLLVNIIKIIAPITFTTNYIYIHKTFHNFDIYPNKNPPKLPRNTAQNLLLFTITTLHI